MHALSLVCLHNPYGDKYQWKEVKVERNVIFLSNATIYNLCYDPPALRSEQKSEGMFLLAEQNATNHGL